MNESQKVSKTEAQYFKHGINAINLSNSGDAVINQFFMDSDIPVSKKAKIAFELAEIAAIRKTGTADNVNGYYNQKTSDNTSVLKKDDPSTIQKANNNNLMYDSPIEQSQPIYLNQGDIYNPFIDIPDSFLSDINEDKATKHKDHHKSRAKESDKKSKTKHHKKTHQKHKKINNQLEDLKHKSKQVHKTTTPHTKRKTKTEDYEKKR